MVLHEIREELTQQSVLELDGNGFGILQKKITLQRGQLHNILQCDIFQDAIPTSDVEPDAGPFIEFFVTPYPIIYSNMNLKASPVALGNRGPSAANENILFKAITGPVSDQSFTDIEQFPNQQLGATPTFSFYTPTVYFTALVHGSSGALVENISYSIYLALESKKANLVSYGLGVMRERSIAQGINLMNQGRIIPPATNVGQIFPMWKYGGIRPERMLNVATSMNYFLNFGNDEAEDMESSNTIRGNVRSSRQMVNFDEAFGRDSPTVGPIPDWIRFDINRGLVSGPIRAQFPPRKLADNGNTLML
jgi:hypothetical protein